MIGISEKKGLFDGSKNGTVYFSKEIILQGLLPIGAFDHVS